MPDERWTWRSAVAGDRPGTRSRCSTRSWPRMRSRTISRSSTRWSRAWLSTTPAVRWWPSPISPAVGYSPQQLAGDLVDHLRQGFLALVAPDWSACPGANGRSLAAQATGRVGGPRPGHGGPRPVSGGHAGRPRPEGQPRGGPGPTRPPRGGRLARSPLGPDRAARARPPAARPPASRAPRLLYDLRGRRPPPPPLTARLGPHPGRGERTLGAVRRQAGPAPIEKPPATPEQSVTDARPPFLGPAPLPAPAGRGIRTGGRVVSHPGIELVQAWGGPHHRVGNDPAPGSDLPTRRRRQRCRGANGGGTSATDCSGVAGGLLDRSRPGLATDCAERLSPRPRRGPRRAVGGGGGGLLPLRSYRDPGARDAGGEGRRPSRAVQCGPGSPRESPPPRGGPVAPGPLRG